MNVRPGNIFTTEIEVSVPWGSFKAYPAQMLHEKRAFIAYHFHWSAAELFGLEYVEKCHWCCSISAMNRRLDGTPANPFEGL